MHLDEDIDLRVLAELSAFPRTFPPHRVALAGEPLGESSSRTRIETAARLLRYTDVPVAEIAYRVGYDTPSSLSKAFRRFFGISPKAYRITKNRPMMNSNIQSDARNPAVETPNQRDSRQNRGLHPRAGKLQPGRLRLLFHPAVGLCQEA